MGQGAQLAIAGVVQVTTRVNVRQGAAATTAPVLRKLNPGTELQVVSVVAGQSVQGNAHWYGLGENAFVWAGACGPLGQTGAGGAPAASAPAPAAAIDPAFAGYGLDPTFAAKLTQLFQACADKGLEFRISQGLRPPRTQARYYCQWTGRPLAKIDASIKMLKDAGASWLAEVVHAERNTPRSSSWLTNALPGAGWHQWGEAADCYCWRNGKMVGNGADPCYKTYADLAKQLGLTAGFYFSTPDAGHVQLRSAGGATDLYPWAHIDEVMRERFGDKPSLGG